MIRHIAFDDIQQDFWGHSPKRDHDLPGLLKKYSDESLLDIALERLESCEVVGLFERFSDSLRLTSHKFGWAPTASFRRHNSTRGSRSGEEVTERGSRSHCRDDAVGPTYL